MTEPHQDKAIAFQARGDDLKASFDAIKLNPLNLNLIMAHTGLLSAIVHDIINDLYPKPLTDTTTDE
jgi:hypothetical protein